MCEILRAGKQRTRGETPDPGEPGRNRRTARAKSPDRSGVSYREFLNDRICQQFGGELGDPGGPGGPARVVRRGTIGGAGDLHLEPLALADRGDLGESEPVTSAGDGLALRIMNLRLEHHVHHYLRHAAQRTRTWHLTGPRERRVLSQRNTMSDDRPAGQPAGGLSR